MDIAILPCATRRSGVGDIGNVDEDDAGAARGIAGDGSNGEDEVAFFVGDDVVGSADGEVFVVTC